MYLWETSHNTFLPSLTNANRFGKSFTVVCFGVNLVHRVSLLCTFMIIPIKMSTHAYVMCIVFGNKIWLEFLIELYKIEFNFPIIFCVFYFVKWYIFIWQIFFAFYFAVNKSISTNAKVLTRKWNSCLELNLSLPEYFNWFPFRELWQKTLKLLAKIENTVAIGLVWTYSPKTGLEHLLQNKHISKAI